MVVWAVVGLVLGGLLAARTAGSGLRVGSLAAGALLGAALGAVSAITFGAQPGVGVGIAAGYLTWIVVMVVAATRRGVDVEDLKARFYPAQTIETSKETLEWLQTRMPPGIG